MARTRRPIGELDTELEDLPAPARWREWMGRVEAVIFASAEPVSRENLARVVGKACSLELIIDDIRDELWGRRMRSSPSPAAGVFGRNCSLATRSGPRSGLRKKPNCRAQTRSS